jgi:hypothetical protein
MALHGAASLALLGTGPVATGAALILCAAGVVGLSRGRQAGARVSGLLVLLLTIVGTLVHAPAIVATAPGLLLWDLVSRHGWIDNASSQVLMVCGVGLFIPSGGSPRCATPQAFVAAVLLAGGLAACPASSAAAWPGIRSPACRPPSLPAPSRSAGLCCWCGAASRSSAHRSPAGARFPSR